MEHLILPAITLAAFSAGVITRMTRSAMLETMGQDHIRMAKAMGVPTRVVVLRLALKNAMAPVLTVIGLEFAYLLVGTFFVERIFALPGLGTYATTSMLSLDYPAIMGVTLLLAFIYVAVNLVDRHDHRQARPARRAELGGRGWRRRPWDAAGERCSWATGGNGTSRP